MRYQNRKIVNRNMIWICAVVLGSILTGPKHWRTKLNWQTTHVYIFRIHWVNVELINMNIIIIIIIISCLETWDVSFCPTMRCHINPDSLCVIRAHRSWIGHQQTHAHSTLCVCIYEECEIRRMTEHMWLCVWVNQRDFHMTDYLLFNMFACVCAAANWWFRMMPWINSSEILLVLLCDHHTPQPPKQFYRVEWITMNMPLYEWPT